MKEKEKKPLRKSASELIAEKRKAEEEARKQKLEEEAKKRKEEEEAQRKAEELARKSREEETIRQQEAEARRAREAELAREQQRAQEEARAREAQLAQNDPPPVVEPPPADKPPLVSDGQRHETFKRGGHSRELGTGDYIIAGVFSSEANATRYTNGLRQLGYSAANGFLTEKQLWYVYIVKTNDIYYARTERDKFRKLRMFKDAWLLTIVE